MSAPHGKSRNTVGTTSGQPQDRVTVARPRQSGTAHVVQSVRVDVTVGQPVWGVGWGWMMADVRVTPIVGWLIVVPVTTGGWMVDALPSSPSCARSAVGARSLSRRRRS